jgi:FtsP/CotA-like multicopper oxidase with cupredoxin domain
VAAQATIREFDEVRLDMNIRFLEREIYNPATGIFDKVRLRGYDDANAGADDINAPLVGPTIETWPGQTLRIGLNNNLPPDDTCGSVDDVNTPHCFNGTNLHSHGLWINPAGNSDNVLISIRPGVSFQYEYNIPSDHPSGTFWYHPHLHGSTALQVSSGMSGAIIVRGDRKPTQSRTGDIDTLLIDESGNTIEDRVLVLQQIQYACSFNEEGKPIYTCKEGETGVIESYEQFGPDTWENSGRYTSINGQVLGAFEPAVVGSPERWRLIHAGVRDTINFEIRAKTGDGQLRQVLTQDIEDWIDANCGGAPVPYGVIAQDGLTMSNVQVRDQAILQPGYRVDALLTFPQAGDYCIIDAAAPADGHLLQAAPSRRLLGFVTAADGTSPDVPVKEYIENWLVEAAQRTMDADIRDSVIADLKDGLKLGNFIPHQDISASEVQGYQELVFNIDTSGQDAIFEIDGQPYDPSRIDRKLTLGGVDEWTLTSDFVSHPFHIHVNPFQVVEILNPEGVDVSAIDANDGGDPQYAGLKGVWKDTLFVKNPGNKPSGTYTVKIRTRYQRYIGEFVLHCHILDHEDKGMMQNVLIALPDGEGGVVHGHH